MSPKYYLHPRVYNMAIEMYGKEWTEAHCVKTEILWTKEDDT